MELSSLSSSDPEIYDLIKKELARQKNVLELIPSENFVSEAILEAMGSILTNKYSEGYPGKRYYGGNENIDGIELLAINRAKKVFNVEHVNVQPYSGSPANFAVYMATCNSGDKIMGLNLLDGGHLTHGWKVNASSIFFNSIPYHVNSQGFIDINEVRSLALANKPKLIWCGATAYSRELPFKEFGEIADEVGAYFAADISHIAGLIASNLHISSSNYCHIITTTTHKTIRGPRGAMIMVTKKGLEKDGELPSKIDKAVFPGLQGGPHNHITAAIAVALKEMMNPKFKEYSSQVIKNSKALAQSLMKKGIKIVTNGTDNHMILIDLTTFGKGKGIFVQEALDLAGITTNKNTIPNDVSSPFYPSGIRIGTPAITTRSMKEPQMEIISEFIYNVINEVKHYELPSENELRKEYLKKFKSEIENNKKLQEIRGNVLKLCEEFPLYKNVS